MCCLWTAPSLEVYKCGIGEVAHEAKGLLGAPQNILGDTSKNIQDAVNVPGEKLLCIRQQRIFVCLLDVCSLRSNINSAKYFDVEGCEGTRLYPSEHLIICMLV